MFRAAGFGRVVAHACSKLARNGWSNGRRLLQTLLLGIALMLGVSIAQANTWTSWLSSSPFKVTGYELLSKTAVPVPAGSAPLYDYVYKVTIGNSGAAAVDVIAQASSNRSSVTLVDANLGFGNVSANGSKASNDTLVVRAGPFFDRRLDRKVKRLLGWAWEVDGYDPPDLLSGLWTAWLDLSDAFLDNWYKNKLNIVFDWKFQIRGDATPPVISATAPTGLVANGRPTLSGSYSDALAGVSPTLTELTLDGTKVSATATATGVSFTPATALADGVHSVALKVVDAASNAATANWSFTVDTTPPAITGRAPLTDNSAPTSAVTAVFADAVSGINTAQIQLLVDGADVSALATKTGTSVSYQPAARFSGGTHNVTLKVRDQAGNQAMASWSFSVDDSAPAAANLSPASGAELPADVVPTVSATLSDSGAGIDARQTRLFVDGADVTAQATITDTSVSWRPAAALAEGNHAVKLVVADRNGNSGETTWTFTTRTLPTITAITPKDVWVNGLVPVQIQAQYQDVGAGIDAARVTLQLDGVDVTARSEITATGLRHVPTTLAQGVHQVQLTVHDKAGFSSKASWQFSVDTVAPAVDDQQPANAATNQTRPTISAKVQDAGSGLDIAKTRLLVDGQDVTAQAQVTTAAGVTTLSWQPATPLSDGAHTAAVQAEDKAGNHVDSVWNFTVDANGPVVSAQQPKDGYASSATPTISASYADAGSGVSTTTVRVTLDGTDVTAAAQVTATGFSYQPPAALADGTHQVVLVLKDAAGNETRANWQFGVDAVRPVIAGRQPIDTQVNTTRPTITAQLSDAGSGLDLSKTKLLVNSVDVSAQVQINSATSPATLSYVPAAPLTGNTQAVVLSVFDLAGNRTDSSWSFTLDGEAPVIVGLSIAEGSVLAADALPNVQLQFSDTGTGINAGSLLVELDGQNVTTLGTTTAQGFSYTPAQPLAEGAHTLRVRVADAAGNVSEKTVGFVTRTAPVIGDAQPRDKILAGSAQPTISASYSDVGSGIDTAKVKLLLNGTDVTAQASVGPSGVSYAVPQPLPDATHGVSLSVTDKAGNLTQLDWQFGTAQPPEILSQSPKDVVLPPGERPTISASFRDTRVGIDTAQIHLIVNGEDVTRSAQVSATGVSYTPPAVLAAGPYTVYLEVANQANAVTGAAWGFTIDEAKVYDVSFRSPSGTVSGANARATVQVAASANRSSVASVTVNGVRLTFASATDAGLAVYEGQVDLLDGTNTLVATAVFADGTTRTATTSLAYDAPPRVTITAPVDKTTFGRVVSTSPQDLTGNVERPVVVTGTVSKPVASVSINQQAAALSNGGRSFTFNNFFLHEGMNVLTVVATDAAGRTGTAAMMLSVDQTAPILSIEHPAAASITSASAIDVRGVVNDAVEGFAGAPEPEVTVNGVKALVSDRYYLAQSVPLLVGENKLTVIATDKQGNSRTQIISISRVAVGSNRLTILGGNHQETGGGTELANPLSIVALDAAGQPLANLPVSFDVLRGTGSISTVQGQASKPNGLDDARNLIVRTDAGGRAQVWFTTGRTTGAGANVVRASATVGQGSAAVAEDVHFSATTRAGVPAKVLADLGINQFAEAGAQPLELMSVIVRDKADNHLVGVPVTFTVEQGDAFFPGANGERAASITLVTDKNGLTATRPLLGNVPGLVRIVARAALADGGGPVGNATFHVQVKEPRDGPTTFKGFIYTDKGEPLPGIRISVARTSLSSTTDEKGAFVLTGLPPGRIDLFVDGRTTTYQGKTWPSLHFEAFAVRGQESVLPHPVYLPPLLMGEAKTVGGNEDVILKIPGIDGFQMKVKANSVTFPDGSKVGTLVVSPVAADRLPMAPPAGGSQFGIPAWTVQPAGTRFDPPIEVTIPNSRAYPRGETQPVVQWDHDLSQFVPMGRATVSEDGAVLVTDAGGGLTKAGWGGLCVYDPDKCGKDSPKCGDCQKAATKPGDSCPTCDFDPSGGPFPKTSMGVDIALREWGPTGLLKVLFSNVLGIEGSFSLRVKGERAAEPICCERTKSKKEKQTTQVAAAFEFSIQGDVGKATPIGRALAAFQTAMFVRFKGGGAGQFAWETNYCNEEKNWDVPPSGSAQITSAGEAGLRFGSVQPVGNEPISGVAIEGYAGLEAQAEATPSSAGSGYLFDVKSRLNAYFQVDVLMPLGSMTLFKRNYEVPNSTSVDIRSLAP